MQFLVIAGSVEPLDLAHVGDAPIRSDRYREELIARGKIVTHAHIAGHRAHMWIFEVESTDELDDIMTRDPMSPYTSGSPQIYPLTSSERMRQREALFEKGLNESARSPRDGS
jgi:muconolactone delta-isomerase